MKDNYKSEQLGVLHETGVALYEIGAITADEMREYDEDCLVPQENASTKAPKVLEIVDHPVTA
jgi:DNA-binding transcriptional regulator YiaG